MPQSSGAWVRTPIWMERSGLTMPSRTARRDEGAVRELLAVVGPGVLVRVELHQRQRPVFLGMRLEQRPGDEMVAAEREEVHVGVEDRRAPPPRSSRGWSAGCAGRAPRRRSRRRRARRRCRSRRDIAGRRRRSPRRGGSPAGRSGRPGGWSPSRRAGCRGWRDRRRSGRGCSAAA